MERWGFSYKSSLVWVKPSPGLGYWFRSRHELLLVGTRGKPRAPAQGTQPQSVLCAPRRGHSEKPYEVHAMIETLYPTARKLEMFARVSREGWTAWGNEVV
jgi:N6-adenosine-specific RNA methylase IME4